MLPRYMLSLLSVWASSRKIATRVWCNLRWQTDRIMLDSLYHWRLHPTDVIILRGIEPIGNTVRLLRSVRVVDTTENACSSPSDVQLAGGAVPRLHSIILLQLLRPNSDGQRAQLPIEWPDRHGCPSTAADVPLYPANVQAPGHLSAGQGHPAVRDQHTRRS